MALNLFVAIAKEGLQSLIGLTDDKFLLYLKECEYRFNNKKDNLH